MRRDKNLIIPPPATPTAPTATAALRMPGDAFFALIAARTGLAIRVKDRETVARALLARMAARDLDEAAYLKLLSNHGDASQDEWRILAPALTNGESYFWRDKGQFELLRREILPLLARGRPRELRLWSAGCSTGEEVYSLAMLCHELFADNRPRIQIIGTDLNDDALERARRGCYGHWSFRGVAPQLQERYFTRQSDGWHVKAELRASVNFRSFNLCAPREEARANGLSDFDLILCRNVLIYLSPAAIDGAVALFGGALRAGGFLMTGHAELANRNLSDLAPRSWPESLVFHKTAPTIAAPLSMPIARAQPKSVAAPTKTAPVPRARAARDFVADKSDVIESPLTRAQKLADAGDHAAALAACREATEAAPFEAEAYLLWARIEIERGETAHAKALLKKVNYLAPDQADGFLELAALYEADDDEFRAEKMRAIARQIGAAKTD